MEKERKELVENFSLIRQEILEFKLITKEKELKIQSLITENEVLQREIKKVSLFFSKLKK